MESTTFVGFLSRLVASEEFKLLHEHLAALFHTSYRSNCEENTSFCCELIELHAKLQGQLFRLLELCCVEGGIHGGSEALKNRLLPWLCGGFISSRIKPEDSEDIKEKYELSLKRLEEDFTSSQVETSELKVKLADAEDELRALRRHLKEGHQGNEQAQKEMEKKLLHANTELRARDRQIKELIKETIELKRENLDLHERLQKRLLKSVTEPESVSLMTRPFLSGVFPVHQSRSAKLVERFTELYKNERVELMNSLNRMTDRSTRERIVFLLVEECFTVSKHEQQQMRSRMTQALQPSHGDLGDDRQITKLVENYMTKNMELLDVEAIIPNVVNALHRDSSISAFIPCNEKLLVPFVRELLRVAWCLTSLDPPIDTPAALEGDIINGACYRRACHSQFSATTIHHFVWPALIRDGKVITKGEVVTGRLTTEKYRKEIALSTPLPGSAVPFSCNSSYDLGFGSASSSWSENT